MIRLASYSALLCLDIKKAFDTVNHDKLIDILISINFPISLIMLISNYLTGRSQIVQFKNNTSAPLPVLSGIPQGSVLGPVLFSIYINSLIPSRPHIPYIKFADDTTFIIPIPLNANINDIILEEIKHVDSWCSSFSMELNKSKTQVLLISNRKANKTPIFINDIDISFNQVTVLGFTITTNLS